MLSTILTFLTNNIGTIVVGLIVLGIIALVIRSMIKDKINNKGCGGNCGKCKGCH